MVKIHFVPRSRQSTLVMKTDQVVMWGEGEWPLLVGITMNVTEIQSAGRTYNLLNVTRGSNDSNYWTVKG
jgi:hypothetical protein